MNEEGLLNTINEIQAGVLFNVPMDCCLGSLSCTFIYFHISPCQLSETIPERNGIELVTEYGMGKKLKSGGGS